jgi:voltage-gated sodium channel
MQEPDHQKSTVASETAYTQFIDSTSRRDNRGDVKSAASERSSHAALTWEDPRIHLASPHGGGTSNKSGMTKPITAADDTESISSHFSLGGSTTDGIDVLKGALGKPNNLLDWAHLIAARIVTSVVYKRLMLVLILVTSLLLALRTVDMIRDSSDDAIEVMNRILHVLLVLFTIEVLLAVVCFKNLFLPTGWLLSDIFIVCLVWWTNDLTFLVLRSFRLLRALRKASCVPSLQWAVRAILHVLPRLSAVILVLLPLMLSIFAILFTNLYQEGEFYTSSTYTDDAGGTQNFLTVTNYFGRLDVSALTLFQIMTGGLNWAEVCEALMAHYPLAWLPMVAFVIISMFFAMTLVIALMCDAVSTVQRDRMRKTLESSTIQFQHPNKKMNVPSNSSDAAEYEEPAPTTFQKQDRQRLEQKVDELTQTVETLLRMQVELQKSIEVLTIQQQENAVVKQAVPPITQFQPLRHFTSLRNATSGSSASYSTALVPTIPTATTVPSDEH